MVSFKSDLKGEKSPFFSGKSDDIFPSSGFNSLGNCPKYRITTPTCRFLTIENVFFSNLTNEIFPQLASSCSINHFLRRFRAFDGSSNRNDFSKALAAKKFVNPAEGLLLIKAAESILDDLQIVSSGHQLSKLPKGKRQKPQNFQLPSAMSRQKLKVKMLWATEETCKTQKKHWHGSDWPSEASLGDFAHPFLVPPLPVDASFVGGMWGCVMGVMSITCMLKKSFKINLFRNIISVLRCTTSLSVFVGWDRTASGNCTLS